MLAVLLTDQTFFDIHPFPNFNLSKFENFSTQFDNKYSVVFWLWWTKNDQPVISKALNVLSVSKFVTFSCLNRKIYFCRANHNVSCNFYIPNKYTWQNANVRRPNVGIYADLDLGKKKMSKLLYGNYAVA